MAAAAGAAPAVAAAAAGFVAPRGRKQQARLSKSNRPAAPPRSPRSAVAPLSLEAQKQVVAEALDAGESGRSAAKRAGVSAHTTRKWLKRCALPVGGRGRKDLLHPTEVDELRARAAAAQQADRSSRRRS